MPYIAYDQRGQEKTLSKGFSQTYFQDWLKKKGYSLTNPVPTPKTTTTNPYLQKSGESIQDYTKRINTTNQGKTPIPSVSKGKSYDIVKGDTLSEIAQAKGTSVAELMKINPQITNPNLIYAGKKLNLPGEESGVLDYSSVSTLEEANEIINQDQDKDIDEAGLDGDPETRKTTEEIIEEITTSVEPEEDKPGNADFTAAYTGYREEYGVNDLETELNDLRAEEQDLQAQKRTRSAAERGKTVAMNVISGKVSEVERQEMERIDAVQRSISNVTNQLNTKYNIINTLMTTKEMDYNSAVSSYDKEMANNISLFNIAKNIESADKTEIEREKDDARSNAQITLNAYTSAGVGYDQLSDTEKVSLTKLGIQSGLGVDFFSNVLKVSAKKEILTTIVSADDTRATILYKDGTTKTITTGLPARQLSTTKPTADEITSFYKQSMVGELSKVVEASGYVSPANWAKARKQWASTTAYSAAEFDDAFRGYVDPSHPQDYAGFENYDPNFIKKSTKSDTEKLFEQLNKNK